ncbi:MAG: pirin family protein [Proteobacteria bacterium]|nr:pirin family protein [Pseudomonadota bacterium]
MITIRPSEERGPADFGWLKARHSFSFGNYYDPRHMGFRNLRVINEDRVAAGAGFPTHGHRDMEIVTYLLDGELEHKDSMGNGEVIRPGEVQAMSAGTGVLHSEFNPSDANPTHLLQIWLLPDKQGHTPRYDQKVFSRDEKLNKLRLVVSPDGADDSIFIHQDSKIYASILEAGKSVSLDLAPKRHAWVQVARGEVALGENVLKAGDGAAISDLAKLEIKGIADASEFLVFDLN